MQGVRLDVQDWRRRRPGLERLAFLLLDLEGATEAGGTSDAVTTTPEKLVPSALWCENHLRVWAMTCRGPLVSRSYVQRRLRSTLTLALMTAIGRGALCWSPIASIWSQSASALSVRNRGVLP